MTAQADVGSRGHERHGKGAAMGRQDGENLIHPRETRAEAKSRVTDATSRAIIEDELAERERKTAKLRAARLNKEAKEEPPEIGRAQKAR